MKTKIILCFAGFAMTLNSFSQIKVFTGGSVTIGATNSPALNSVNHQIIGGKIIFPASTAAITSAPLINGQNALSSSPGFAFHGDANTGIAHPASSVLAITIANVEKFRFNSSGQILNKNTTSSSATPDYSWDSDPNTGVYRAGNDNLGFSTFGRGRFVINANGQLTASETPRSAGAPDYTWNDDPNTGIYHPAGADVLAFSTGGTESARFNSTGKFLVNGAADDGWLSVKSTDYAAASYSVTLNSDWATVSSITYINRANSSHYELRLNGVSKFWVAGQGWIFSEGNYLGSDRNIKDDIKGIDSAISRVKKINGVTYKLKAEKQNPSVYGTAQEYMGVIAQDVEKAAPQVVKTLPDGTKAVCYEMLVGLLIEALKEHDNRITQLSNDVNNCCTKSGQLQNRTVVSPEDNGSEESGSYIRQNSPNPFNKETIIEFFIAEKNAASSMLIMDMTGKLLKTLKLNSSGSGSVTINSNELTPGMYYYSLIVNAKEVGTKKMILTE